eukprot:233205-Pyramimonas_sp.AAC.1
MAILSVLPAGAYTSDLFENGPSSAVRGGQDRNAVAVDRRVGAPAELLDQVDPETVVGRGGTRLRGGERPL